MEVFIKKIHCRSQTSYISANSETQRLAYLRNFEFKVDGIEVLIFFLEFYRLLQIFKWTPLTLLFNFVLFTCVFSFLWTKCKEFNIDSTPLRKFHNAFGIRIGNLIELYNKINDNLHQKLIINDSRRHYYHRLKSFIEQYPP